MLSVPTVLGNAKTSDSGTDSGRKNPRFSFLSNLNQVIYKPSDIRVMSDRYKEYAVAIYKSRME